jgi:endonuclease/exonuclease/phosphatase family metal-dependent hydrolase
MNRSLSVISSNIRYDEPDDDQHVWKNRRDFLVSLLLDYAPDILATQEGRLPQIRDIDDRLTGLSCADSHRGWAGALMYPCLFYNPASLTLSDSGDIWLSDSPTVEGSRSFGSAFPRLCTWASFDEGVLAVNVHLDNLSDETRLCQIQVLIEQLSELKKQFHTTILMGDFNESPGGAVRSLINQEWPDLKDPWLQLGNAEESSHHHFHEPIDYGSRVDWILTSDSLLAQEILLDKSQSEQGLFPSDHYILKSRFLWHSAK